MSSKKLIDMADSANLYLTSHQGHLYSRVTQDEQYARGVLTPLIRGGLHLPELWKAITHDKGRKLVLVDCGPALEGDGKFHVDLFAPVSNLERYVALDVNQDLLSIAIDSLVKTSIQVQTIQGTFERIPRSSLDIPPDSEALFLLGSTFMNYEIEAIRKIFSSLAQPGDLLALQALLQPDDNIRPEGYESEDVLAFTFAPLELLGARQEDFIATVVWQSERIEFRFQAKTEIYINHPQCSLIEEGDIVLTGFSRRPPRREHEKELRSLFSQSYTKISHGVATSIGLLQG